jgi:hypothetical protein
MSLQETTIDSPEEPMPMMLHDEFYASYDEFVNSRGAPLSERETEVQTPRPSEKKNPPDRNQAGFPVVVEVRRLELLTPYMRSKCSTN